MLRERMMYSIRWTLVSSCRAISPTVNNNGGCDIDFLAARGEASQQLPVDGQAAKPKTRGTKICEVARFAGEWQIQQKLAVNDHGRARSRLAGLVAGWLTEWLGGRASGIMEIKAGLSNSFLSPRSARQSPWSQWHFYTAKHGENLCGENTGRPRRETFYHHHFDMD